MVSLSPKLSAASYTTHFFLEEFVPFEFSAHDIPEVIDPLLLIEVFQTIHPFVAEFDSCSWENMGQHFLSFLESHLTFVYGLIAWYPAKHLYSGSAEAVGSRKCKESVRDLPGGVRPPTKSQVPFLSHFPRHCSFSFLSPVCLTLESCRCHPFHPWGGLVYWAPPAQSSVMMTHTEAK